ncbi:unnamed protein product [Ixodes pacificus]
MGCLGNCSLSKSPQPYTETAECSSVQKKAAASGQQDVLGGANLSKGLPLGLKQGEHKGDVASKHSSVLEASRPDSSKHLFGIVEQVQSWNSGVPTPPVSLGGMSSATDVQKVQVKSRSNETMKLPALSESVSSKGLCSAAVKAASKAGEPSKQLVLSKREGSLKDSHVVPLQKKSRSEKSSKIPAVSEGASLKDLHSVAVQTASKAEESLKPPVLSGGEGSSKDIDVVPVQEKSGSNESSNPPVVSENVSLKDVCRAVVQEGLKTEETFTLPNLLEEVSSSKNTLTSPALVNSQSDEALKPSTVLEESDPLKDSNCATIEGKSKPDKRLKPPTLSGGCRSLEALPDMPAHAESKNDEVSKSPFASEEGDALADFNNLPLEKNSRSDKSLKVTMSDVNGSERDIYAVPAQVKLKNDETLTPPFISGKGDTLRDLHAALVQNILESDQTLKPSIVPENTSSLKNFSDLPGQARTESDDKVLDMLTGSGCTSQDFHNTSKHSVFEGDELSTSAISEEFTSRDICAVPEQVVAEIDVSLELPAAAGDACLCEGVQSVPERSESEQYETLEPSEVTSTNGSASYSGEQDGQEHDSWDALFDESGECFDPGVLKDITQALGDIKVQYAELDYTKFEPHIPDLSEAGDILLVNAEYGHILEIYNFPPEFETKDVVSGLSCSKDQFNIKWVDDTHVLAVFSTPFAATEALSLQTPLMKMRHISEASKQSKLKVKRCAEFLQPVKPRPQTSASVARRLVSGALGLRVQVEPEQRRRELQMLREAKGRRKTVAKQRTDAWNGDVA